MKLMKTRLVRIICDDDFSIKSLNNKTFEEIKNISEKNKIKLNSDHHHIMEFIGSFNEKDKLVTVDTNSVQIHKPIEKIKF